MDLVIYGLLQVWYILFRAFDYIYWKSNRETYMYLYADMRS